MEAYRSRLHLIGCLLEDLGIMTIENKAAISDEVVTPAWYARADFKRRVLITLAALALYRIAENIPLPGIELPYWKAAQAKESLFTLMFAPDDVSELSIMAMGVMPLLIACVAFELLRLCAPSFWHWLEAAPKRRIRAQGALYVCALFWAAWQAPSVADEIPNINSADDFWSFVMIASLIGGVALSIGLATWINRAGPGYGIWVVAAFVYCSDGLNKLEASVVLRDATAIEHGLIFLTFVVCAAVIVKIERARGYSGEAASVMNPGGFWPPLMAYLLAMWIAAIGHVLVYPFFGTDYILAANSIERSIRFGASVVLSGLFFWRYEAIARKHGTYAGSAGLAPDWVKCWILFSAMFLAEFLLGYFARLSPLIASAKLALIVITILRIASVNRGPVAEGDKTHSGHSRLARQ